MRAAPPAIAEALALLYLVGIFALVGGMWREFKLETDFGAFIKADGEATAAARSIGRPRGFSVHRRRRGHGLRGTARAREPRTALPLASHAPQVCISALLL